MENLLVEIAKQIPWAAVFLVLVWWFLRHIEKKGEQSNATQQKLIDQSATTQQKLIDNFAISQREMVAQFSASINSMTTNSTKAMEDLVKQIANLQNDLTRHATETTQAIGEMHRAVAVAKRSRKKAAL